MMVEVFLQEGQIIAVGMRADHRESGFRIVAGTPARQPMGIVDQQREIVGESRQSATNKKVQE